MSKSPLSRATALVAGSLIGMAGVVAFASPAQAHHSTVVGTANCDTVSGKYVVDWTVNGIGSPQKLTFQFTKVELLPAGTKFEEPVTIVEGKDLDNGRYTGKQLVPGDAKSATLTVKAWWGENAGDQSDVSKTVPLGGDCKKPETPAENPSTPAEQPSTPAEQPSTPAEQPSTPAEQPSTPTDEPSTPVSIPEDVPAEPIFNVTCDTIEIGVDNTKNTTPFKVDYETSKGEKRSLTIPAGKKGSELFSATEGFSVNVTFTVEYKGKTYTESGTIPFEKPAEGCDDGGNGGGLPVTGAAAGGVAGGAAVLLAVGAGMFFVARRRKVKFTA
ncbi:hypothetical protein GCM10025331_72060 [Actinoplanes utahensis]|nr:hypothetical protein Aut01nite_82910 [Actinoplanes utahensis]